MMQRFAPGMSERGWGRILTIGSVQELKPHPAMLVYAGTKAAIANTVRSVALQLADKGVTANNLSPGVIETPRTDEPTPPIPDHISQRMTISIGFEGQTIFIDGGMGL